MCMNECDTVYSFSTGNLFDGLFGNRERLGNIPRDCFLKTLEATK